MHIHAFMSQRRRAEPARYRRISARRKQTGRFRCNQLNYDTANLRNYSATARLHNGPSQTNAIIPVYVSLGVKYEGNPDGRRAFKGDFHSGGIPPRGRGGEHTWGSDLRSKL